MCRPLSSLGGEAYVTHDSDHAIDGSSPWLTVTPQKREHTGADYGEGRFIRLGAGGTRQRLRSPYRWPGRPILQTHVFRLRTVQHQQPRPQYELYRPVRPHRQRQVLRRTVHHQLLRRKSVRDPRLPRQRTGLHKPSETSAASATWA